MWLRGAMVYLVIDFVSLDVVSWPAMSAVLFSPRPPHKLPFGEEDVISFSLVRSCFLNLARLFWNQTCEELRVMLED